MGWGGGLMDFSVTPVPIGLGFWTGLGLGLGLRGPDLGLGLDNYNYCKAFWCQSTLINDGNVSYVDDGRYLRQTSKPFTPTHLHP